MPQGTRYIVVLLIIIEQIWQEEHHFMYSSQQDANPQIPSQIYSQTLLRG